MAKPEQVLNIDPQGELRFRGPFTGDPVTAYIKLTNPTPHKVYFKIKTTAPKRYCVRPNSGILMSQEVKKITVSLQSHDFDPMDKNKHKFMIQSLIAQDDDDEHFSTEVWKDTKPEQLMDTKLKCVFENPVTSTATAKTTAITTTAAATKADSNTNDGKYKGTGDSIKSSPKVLEETEEKLMKAAQEVNQLRVEESTLRQENLQLREDLLKWRNVALLENQLASDGLPSHSTDKISPTSSSIIIAIAMVILGYVLGKLI